MDRSCAARSPSHITYGHRDQLAAGLLTQSLSEIGAGLLANEDDFIPDAETYRGQHATSNIIAPVEA